MKFGSVCSGIEAASVAFNPLGWEAAWVAEIEPFPCSVLAHHYPDVPNLGDMTKIVDQINNFQIEAPDMLCGGTPCQALSVAGLRNSLDDARGNLSLTFCEIANAIDTTRALWGDQPCIVFWENVPGVLNTKDNAFGCFLAGLAGEDAALVPPGGKWTNAGFVYGPQRTVAWRILDAQYFGLAQRRKRVFVVASARAGFDPCKVLFEFDSVRRDSAPSREAGKDVAGSITQRIDRGGVNSEGSDGHIVPTVAGTVEASLGRSRGAGTPTSGIVPVGISQDSEFGVKRYDSAGTLRAGRIPEHQMVIQPLVPIGWSEELNALEDLQPTIQRGGAGGRHEGVAVPIMHTEFSPALKARDYKGPSSDGDGDGAVLVPMAYSIHENQRAELRLHDTANALSGGGGKPGQGYPAVAFSIQGNMVGRCDTAGPQGVGVGVELCFTQTKVDVHAVSRGMQVRRLTPTECARLQGFPDDYLDILHRGKPAADGPKYKALGNSWAVPVVRWIGERIHSAVYANTTQNSAVAIETIPAPGTT